MGLGCFDREAALSRNVREVVAEITFVIRLVVRLGETLEHDTELGTVGHLRRVTDNNGSAGPYNSRHFAHHLASSALRQFVKQEDTGDRIEVTVGER